MNRVIRQVVVFLFLLCGAVGHCAQPGRPVQPVLTCAVCRETIQGVYHWLENPALPAKRIVCDSCTHIENYCFVCQMPVKVGYQKLEDGRFLCEQDSKVAVVSQSDAERIWQEAHRELLKMFSGSGTAPATITLSLVDQTQLMNLYSRQVSWHDKTTTLGLTQTRIKNRTEFEHTIYVLSAMNPARLAAVCAHEYAHAWLHENVGRERALEVNTVEGFCELVAYKLMTQRNEAVEKRVILANTYTHGKIDTLIQAEDNFRFYRVLDWLKNGVDDRLAPTNMNTLLKLQDSAPAVTLSSLQTAPSRVPDTLTLKGISGSPARRFALINDCTLERNEVGKIRVGKTNVVVRCLEILDNSVVIQARGSPEQIKLLLRRED